MYRKPSLAAAVFVALTATAYGDGLPASMKDVAPSYRAMTCFLGAYGSGSFLQNRTTVTSIADLQTGSAVYGGGPQIGCDIVGQQWLVGVGADYTFQTGAGTTNLLGLTGTTPFGDEWSVWGRVGAFTSQSRHTLLYVLGGAVGAQQKTTTLASLPGPTSGGVGAMVGGGIETILSGNWRGFLEYRHEFLDTHTGMLGGVIPTRLDASEDKVLIGLRYGFGGD